jgi:hypothetical protein
MEWQPIETAPKDGTPVLVGWANGAWQPMICHYEPDQVVPWGALTNVGFAQMPSMPTHWMPLPDGPASDD